MCDAWRNGAPVVENLEIDDTSGSSVTDASAPGVRRQLGLDLIRRPGLFDNLTPTGTELRVRSVLRYPSGVTESVPMGVFDLDAERMGYAPGGVLAVQASDKFVKLQRAEFLLPKSSLHGALVTDQIAILIRDVFGPSEPVVDLTGSTARIGPAVWEGNRAKVINDLAASIGGWVFADRDGVFTIAPLPTAPTGQGVWRVDAGGDAVLLDADRARDRSKTRNVVVAVQDENADGVAPFPPQVVWDSDPTSPTYAGTNPLSPTNVPGPFGIVPHRFSSPLFQTAFHARQAALARLSTLMGLSSRMSLSASRNHALDAMDTLTVVLPPERYDLQPVVERHLIDKVTHPLTPGGVQSIETRATGAVDLS